MSDLNRISAVIITHNEELNIARCLDSISLVVDEIVVYDSNSNDNTARICESFGVNFYRGEWMGYGATKNHANSLTTSHYILSLDADEALSDELRNSILEEKRNGLQGTYRLNRLNNYCGIWIKYGGWYPDRKLRLFPKEKAHWSDDEVHEKLILDSGIRVKQLQGDLLHYSYYTKTQHIVREKKYAALAAQKDRENKRYTSLMLSVFAAAFKFFRMYVLKAGFMHGKAGFQFCSIAAMGKIWRYSYRLANPK